MSELIEFYFAFSYQIVGRLIYGKNFSKQDSVPLYIKTIAISLPTLVFALFVVVVIKINN